MVENIYEYIKRPKQERQEHLDLDDYCIERGGGSTLCKGLLANETHTTIPDGHMILVCHACNNGKCSNPKHLYWGTPSENRMDRVRFENRTLIERMEDSYRRKGPLNKSKL